jgi:hypothetical protein
VTEDADYMRVPLTDGSERPDTDLRLMFLSGTAFFSPFTQRRLGLLIAYRLVPRLILHLYSRGSRQTPVGAEFSNLAAVRWLG